MKIKKDMRENETKLTTFMLKNKQKNEKKRKEKKERGRRRRGKISKKESQTIAL